MSSLDRLTEREIDKLLVFTAADVARRRKTRGLKLNHPEAIALISAEVLEGIRDGRSVAELMTLGAHGPRPRRRDGGRARDDQGNPGRRHVPRRHEARHRPRSDPLGDAVVPGEYILQDGVVELNAGRDAASACASPTPAIARSRSAPTRISSRSTQALRFDRDAGVRPAARRAGRHVAALRARRSARRRRSSRWPAAGRLRHERARQRSAGRRSTRQHEDSARRLREPLRSDDGRSRPPRRTPTCSSRSSATSPSTAKKSTFGGGKVIRDGQGQSQIIARRRRAGPRHHQRHRARLLGRGEGGRRRPRRPHLRHRQGRQSRHPGRRHAGAGDRAVHGDHRRRAPDPHRRRHRRAHPLHQPAAGLGGALQRRDDDDRRRHRAGRGHARDDLHARRVEHPPDDRSDAGPADELRLSRQGQRVDARARSSSRCAPARWG